MTRECFLIVLDTVIDDLKLDSKRPRGTGSSPKDCYKRIYF